MPLPVELLAAVIGVLTDLGVSEDDAHLYAEGVRRGGTLVTAKVDDARASEAQAILQGSNWVDTCRTSPEPQRARLDALDATLGLAPESKKSATDIVER